ncbi:MAG TPA: EthD family reductase [Alphaproteobacteria bacterium]
MIKLTLLYGHPADPAAFERYYASVHLPLAAQMQGIRRAEFSKVIAPADGEAPFYRIGELWFDSIPHLQSVLATPEAQKVVADLPKFATGGVTTLMSEIP